MSQLGLLRRREALRPHGARATRQAARLCAALPAERRGAGGVPAHCDAGDSPRLAVPRRRPLPDTCCLPLPSVSLPPVYVHDTTSPRQVSLPWFGLSAPTPLGTPLNFDSSLPPADSAPRPVVLRPPPASALDPAAQARRSRLRRARLASRGPVCSRDAAEMHSRDAAEMQPRCSRDAAN